MNRREMFAYLEKNIDKVKEIDQKFLEAHCSNINEVVYNWEIRTIDEKVFWKSIDLINGWKLQINSITNNCRILDEKGFRKCYGPRGLVLGPIVYQLQCEKQLV